MAVQDLQIEQHPSETVVDDARPLATLSLAPEQLTARAGVDWFEGDDDLDDFQAAALSVASDDPVFLLRAYRRDPQRGTLLLGSPAVSSSAVDAVLHALKVRPSEIVDRVDMAGTPGKSLDLRQLEELEQSLLMISSAMHRLRGEAAEALRASLAEGGASEGRDRLWLADAVQHVRLGDLSRRQREVLTGLAGGMTNAEIAAALGITEETVRSHLRSLRNRVAHSGA